MKKLSGLLLGALLLLSGCAAKYHRINPNKLSYSTREDTNGIVFSYKHGVLRDSGNKKYAKKEENRAVKLIAVRLINQSDQTIDVARDLAFYSGHSELTIMQPEEIKQVLKQSTLSYLPYLLLSLVTLNVTTDNNTSTYPIGLVIGPGITIGNMAVAGNANKNLTKELHEFNILDKSIPAGQTAYGIIGVRGIGFDPITIKDLR